MSINPGVTMQRRTGGNGENGDFEEPWRALEAQTAVYLSVKLRGPANMRFGSTFMALFSLLPPVQFHGHGLAGSPLARSIDCPGARTAGRFRCNLPDRYKTKPGACPAFRHRERLSGWRNRWRSFGTARAFRIHSTLC